MTRITIFLVAAVLEVSLSGFIGHYRNWDQLRGNHIGFAGKCSALSGLLPDPKSGCCGRHAGANEVNGVVKGDKENYTDNGNSADDKNNDIDDGSNNIDAGSDDIDDGNNEVDDRNNNNDYSGDDEDFYSDQSEDSDYEDGTGNDFSWIGFEGAGSVYDDLRNMFDTSGLNDSNSQAIGFIAKSVVKRNASDIAPGGFITAGTRAGIRQYPWLVHLNIKIRELFQTAIASCGGSLISPRFVLTAAHCVNVNIRSYDDVSIFLAEYNTDTFPTDCVGNTCVTNVVMHPDRIIKHQGFEPMRLSNDIALMRLRRSAPYTEFIRPICLPSFNIDVPNNEGTPLSITGWGSTGRAASPIKLTAQVKLVSHRQCQGYYRDLTPSHLCAASNNGQDTCKGDSGGPIMAEHDGNFYVVGIVSGKGAETSCGSSVPTLYTNVFQFRQWIQENMRV